MWILDVTLKNLDTEGRYYVISRETDESEPPRSRLRSDDDKSHPVASSIRRRHGDDRASPQRLERGPDGDDHRCGQSFRRRPVLRDPSAGGHTTSDLGYKYVDPEDVTLKNLDTEMGGYYVSSVSGDTDEMVRRPRSRCVCEVSRPITSRSMWLLRIRAKAR